MESNLKTRYLRTLEPWALAAQEHIHVPPDRPDLACYGTGYNAWGVQTNQKALAALAVLGTDPDLDERRAGVSRDTIVEQALRMLRFSLSSHIAGDYHCTDGTSWGHTWISSLGIERMMHGVTALLPHFTGSDEELLRQVMCSECDWLLDGYRRSHAEEPGTVKAGLTANNDPESNLWNGIVLCRTAAMFPEVPRAAEYRDKGLTFIMNGISVEADADSNLMLDGVRLADRHVGANFFPSYALNHHRYMNVGYMIICLSQVAMAHFWWKSRDEAAPESIYLHAHDLWKTVRNMIFPDGRLCRIGGDTRARYCYCQDYAIPTWLLMLDCFGEGECIDYEARWLDTVRHDRDSGDGHSFLSARLDSMKRVSPTYYTRLESDRAVSLSMGVCWRRAFSSIPEQSERGLSIQCEWDDEYHGSSFVRGVNRIASWTWRAAELPQGLCVPVNRSDMAEWRWNLAGRICGVGARNVGVPESHQHRVFEGGFVNSGICRIRSEQNLAEGEADKDIAIERIAFVALPDDATVVGIQYALAVNRAMVSSVKGIHAVIPNDIFNNGSRHYMSAGGMQQLEGPSRTFEVIDLRSSWLNIDDVMTIEQLDGSSLSVVRPGRRQIEIHNKPISVSSLHADEICSPCRLELRSYDDGTPILDVAFAVGVGESADAAQQRAREPGTGLNRGDGFRSVEIHGRDNRRYLVVYNVDEKAVHANAPVSPGSTPGERTSSDRVARDLVSGEQLAIHEDSVSVPLRSGEAKAFVLI